MVSRNPFLNRQQQAPKNSHGKKSEDRLAKSIGARLTPASGATAGAKGDMKHLSYGFRFLIESKSTVNATLPIDIHWLQKITKEAMDKSMYPALSLSFVLPDGKALPHGDWVAVPVFVWQELLEKANGD